MNSRIFHFLGIHSKYDCVENLVLVKLSVRNEFLEERRKDADRLREKYPDKVPVIVQVAKSSEIPQTRKPKYLMPKSISIGKVQTILRDYLKDQDVSFNFRF